MPSPRQCQIAVNAALQGSTTFDAFGWKVLETKPGEPILIRNMDGTLLELTLREVPA